MQIEINPKYKQEFMLSVAREDAMLKRKAASSNSQDIATAHAGNESYFH